MTEAVPQSLQDKFENQASGIRAVEDFDALPLSGPGRWAEPYPGITVYTNDANVLFVRGGKGTLEKSTLFQAMENLRQQGKTASEVFDVLRLDAPVNTGDLSELA